MTVVRDGEEQQLTVTVGTLPDQAQASAGDEVDSIEELGFSVQTLTPELAERFELEGVEGVVVTSVDNDSAAFEAGLRPGMVITEVNRVGVDDLESFEDAIDSGGEAKSVLLLVVDPRGSRYIALKR